MNKKLTGFVALAAISLPLVWAGNELVTLVTEAILSKDLPYDEQFVTAEAFDEWTVIDANNDGWTYKWAAFSGLNYQNGSAAFLASQYDVSCEDYADDWLISPAFDLQASRTYHLSFFLRGTVGMQTDMHIYVGRGTEISDMTQQIYAVEDNNYNMVRDLEFAVPEDGIYYIGFHETSYGGETKYTYNYSSYISAVHLEEAASRLVPAPVEALKQHPGTHGELSMQLTWTNPSTDLMGKALEAIQEVRIYKDQNLQPIVLTDNLTAGAQMSWSDPDPVAGTHTYRLTVVNTEGEGYSTSVSTLIGTDLPGEPCNLQLQTEGNQVTLSWEPSEFGRQAGWYNTDGLCYRVVRQPGNVLLTSTLTETTYTDSSITDLNAYSYQVTAINADGVGLTASTDYVQVGRVAQYPVIQDFEDDGVNSLWTIVDGNNDGEGFRIIRDDRGCKAPKALVSDHWNAGISGSNDQLYSPAVKIEKGQTYRITIAANSNLFNSETLYVYYGKDRSEAAMNQLACVFSDITTSGYYDTFSETFVADANFSVGYFMFYAPSFSSRFWMDDIKIEHVTENDVEILDVTNLSTAGSVGKEVSTAVVYKNAGSAQCKGFKVELVDMDGNVLASRSVTRPVNAGVQNTVNLTWTPTQVGKMHYYARATFTSGEDTQPNNNQSDVITYDVLPTDEIAVTSGIEDVLQDWFPFNYYGQGFNESCYPAELLGGATGRIDSIAYKVHFGHARDYYDIHYQIWMGETDVPSLSAGWIPSSELQLVYDGGIDLTYGIKDLIIPLQHPYDYKGGNLVVLLYSDHELYALADGYGLRTYSSYYGQSVTHYWYGAQFRPIDPANPDQSQGRYSDYLPNTMFYLNVAGKGAVQGKVTTGGKALEKAYVSVCGTNLNAATDANGEYTLPYVTPGSQTVIVRKSGYETDSATVQVIAQGSVTQNFDLAVKPQVAFRGHVVGSNDVNTPIEGARVELSLYDTYTAVTDAQGDFGISKVWGNATYLLTIEAAGYQLYTDTIRVAATNYDCQTIVLKQEASQPATVEAVDAGDQATISWTQPIPAHWLRKEQSPAVGEFGGKYNYCIAHRYLPYELESAGIVDGLYVTKVNILATSNATFELKIWQGVTNAEAEVYTQPVTLTNIGDWNEVKLDIPYRIDPTRNLVVGFHISQNAGARPVAFDYGPLVQGGDVLFDDDTNTWTTAHEQMSDVSYNWMMRTYCSVDPNDRELDMTSEVIEEEQTATRRGIGIDDPMLDRNSHSTIFAPSSAYGFTINEERLDQVRAARRDAKSEVPDSTKPLGYSVWRLLNGQEHQESEWTLVTSQPVSDLTCADAAWSQLNEGVYRYAVRSVYAGDVMSEATFSNGVDKGHYAVVNGHITAEIHHAAGAVVSLENTSGYYEAVVDADGNYTIPNVYFGTYTLKVSKSFFETYQATIVIDRNRQTLDEINILVDARKPKAFQAIDYVSNVTMSWAAPSDSRGRWIHKDSDPSDGKGYGMGYNGGGEFEIGHRYTPAELEQFAHGTFYVNCIAIHTYMPGEYEIRIWNGNEGNEFQIYSQKVMINTDGEWTLVQLNEPVKIDPYQSYVFGYYVKHESGYYPCGVDDGPAVEGGDAIYYNGGWHSFFQATAGNYSINWAVRTFVTDEPNEVADLESMLDTESARLVVNNGKRQAPAADEAMPITYKVWRTTEAAKTHSTQWQLITPQAIAETSLVDTTWPEVADGAYYYVVKAVYDGQVESQAVYSTVLDKGTTSLVNINLTTNNDELVDGVYVTLMNDDHKYSATSHNQIATMTGVYYGTYTLTVQCDGYEDYSQQVTIDQTTTELTVQLRELLLMPSGVKARVTADNNVLVTWRTPGTYSPTPGWFYWDNNQYYAAFSMNGSFFGVGHVYSPLDQAELGMKELYITQFSFPVLDYSLMDSTRYEPTDGTYYLKIWRGETLEEVYSQKVESYEKNAWNTYTLDTPYYVDGTDFLMFGYEFTGTGFPAAIDQGPAVPNKGDIGATSQGSWVPLNQAGYNYNFVFHVLGEEAETESARLAHQRVFDGAEAYDTAVAPEFSGSLSGLTLGQEMQLPAPSHQAKAAARTTASNITYLVYRRKSKDTFEIQWNQLTPEPISELRYEDTEWSTLPHTAYIYVVKAVYASGTSKGAESGSLVPTGIEELTQEGLDVSVTTQGVTITSAQAGQMALYGVAGNLLLAQPVQCGVNEYPVALTPGAYLLEVCGESLVIMVR